jgi:mannose-6-phosphate isomerase-like protein (cupin superfamily)
MTVNRHSQLERASLPGIEHVTLAGHSDGLSTLSIWKQSLAPRAQTPPHRHDCEEVVICESGRGELHIDGRIEAFEGGTTLVIPRNVPHQIFNVGEETLNLIAALGVSPVVVRLPDGTPLDLPWRT